MTVTVENAEPVGGVVHADIKQGTEVMLMVTADVEDEVHVDGYDLSADVAPDHPAHISFLADVAGEFEVELEERTVPIAELAVTPKRRPVWRLRSAKGAGRKVTLGLPCPRPGEQSALMAGRNMAGNARTSVRDIPRLSFARFRRALDSRSATVALPAALDFVSLPDALELVLLQVDPPAPGSTTVAAPPP